MANIFSLDDLRTNLVDKGYVQEDAPDEELIVKYSEATRQDPFEIAQYFGVQTGQGKSFTAGLSSGVDMVQGLGLNAAAAGAAALGFRDAEEGLALAAERQGYEGYLAGNPELEKVENVDSIGGALQYGAYQVGKQGPLLAGLTATTLVNPAAGVAAGASIGVGSLYESAREADGYVSGADLVQIGVKAVPYTLLESLTPMAFSQMIRSGRGGATGAAVGATRGFAGESTTELGQTELEISMNPNLTEEQKDSMRLNAAVAGGVTGGALGTVGGYFGREAPDDSDGIDLTSDRTDSTPVDTNNMEQTELDLEPTFQYEDGRDEIGAPDPFVDANRVALDEAPPVQDVPEFDDEGNYLFNVIYNNEEARLRAVNNTRDRLAELQTAQATRNKTGNRIANVAFKSLEQINQEIAQVDARIAEIEADPNLVSNNPIKPEYRKEYRQLNGQRRALQTRLDQQTKRAGPIAARVELLALQNALISLQDGVDVADMPADQQAALSRTIPEEVQFIRQRDKMQQEMDLTTPDIEVADNQIDEVQGEAVADTTVEEEVIADAPVEESIEVSEEVDTVEDVDTTPTTVDAPMPVAAEGVSQETLEEDFAAESAINETNAENDRLQAEVGTEGRAPTGRVSLDKNIFAGVMRMVKAKEPNPKPVIYKLTKDGKQTTEPDQAATAKNAEKMRRIYKALMNVAATKKKMDDKDSNVFYGRKSENEGRKLKTAQNNARQAKEYQETLREQVKELIDAAEGEGNVQALVSMIKKYRDQFSTATSLSEKASAQYNVQFGKTGPSAKPFQSMLEVLNTVDTELSSAFASYRDGDLTTEYDRINPRPIRDGRKSKDAKTRLERLAEQGGVNAVLKELSKRIGTRSSYVIMLSSAIRYGIENMQKAGFEPTLEFITEGNPYYDRGLNTIFIRKEASEEEILHETLHAATAWFVQSSPNNEAVQELRDALDVVLNTATPEYVQALKVSPASKERINNVMQILRDLKNSGSPDDAVLELISYGTTLRDFKDMLKGIPMADSPTLTGWRAVVDKVWNKLVGLVAQVLGVQGSVANNILGNTYRLIELSIEDGGPVKSNFVAGQLNARVSQGEPNSDMAGNNPDMNEEQQAKRKAYVGRNVTRMVMENLGVPNGIEVMSNYVDKFNDLIREKFPALESTISKFNSRYGVTPALSALMDMWKRTRNTPLTLVNRLILKGFENQSVDRRRAILEYLDNTNLNLIEQYDDSASLKMLANEMMRHYDMFVARLPEQERQLFEGKKFTDTLLYVSDSQDVSNHSLGQRSVADLAKSALMRIDEADIDTNLDLFDLDQNGLPILEGPMYMITVTDSLSGNEYKLIASKKKVDALGRDNLPIGDGYVVHDSTPLEFVRFSAGSYSFREINDYRQNLDDKATERITIGMLNTMAALSNYNASRDFIQGLLNYDGEPVVYDNAEQARAGSGNPNLQVTDAKDLKSADIFERTRSSQHWIRVSDNEGIWGPLAGKVIHAPVWHAMNDMSSRKPLFNARWVNDTMTFFKKTKTVQNPGTHITNIASNVTLAMMHGIPPRTIAKAAKLLWEFEVHPKRFKNPNRAAELQIIQDFYSSGALLGTFSAVEIKNVIHKAHLDTLAESEIGTVDSMVKHFAASEMAKITLVKRVKGFARNLDEFTTQLYAAEDNAFRLAAYMNKLEELGGENTPENQAAAGQAALKMFLDYDIDAPMAKMLRQSVMPFVSWTYAAIPLIARIAAQKPWQLANVFIAYQMLDMVAAGLAGDDEEARKFGPERLDERTFGLRTHIRIPFMGDDNNPVYYKLGDYVPLVSTFSTSPTGFLGFENWPQGFKPSGPLIDGLIMIMTGTDTYTGKPLYETTESDFAKFGEIFEGMTDMFLPPWAQSVKREKVFGALGGDRNIVGQTESLASALATNIMGLKLLDYNVAEEATYRQIRESAVGREYKAAIRKLQREEMRSGAPDYQALYADIQRLELELIEEVKKIYKIED